MRRIFPPFWLLIAVVLMTVLHFVVPLRVLVPMPFSLSGIVFLLTGLSIFGWASRTIFRAKTTIIPFRESSSLVTDGPFRVSRNPIYLAMVLALLGLATLYGSFTPFIVVPAFAMIIDRVFIVAEERMLQTTFDDDYEAYCRRVRRWI